MSKTWLIARHHFKQETSKRSFLIVLFSLPLFLALSVGLGYLTTSLEDEVTTVGYVDQAGLLVKSLQEPAEEVQLVAYEAPETAREALESEAIDGYYVLGADYKQTHEVELVYREEPGWRARNEFAKLVRLNLLAEQSPSTAEWVLDGAELTVLASASNREYPRGEPNLGFFAPLVVAVFFIFQVLTTSGYMMQAVVEEKENRTMEVMMSSVSPAQMMAGKIAGALGIAALQLLVWVTCLVAALWLGGSVLDITWMQGIQPSWRDLLMAVIVAVPSFVFIAALMTALGSTLVESQEAQQAGPLFFIPMFLPIYLVLPITQDPGGALSLGFSFFPLTSVTTIALRSALVQVPAWQVVVSALISLTCAALMIWVAAKAFRVSMLRYGQRLRWREVFGRRRAVSEPVAGRS
jgi:ABC-2 type transport system permease protein